MAPDGSAIAFVAGPAPGQNSGVYVQKLDGSPAYRVSPADTDVNGVPGGWTTWSHDGRHIAYQVTSYTAGSQEGAAYVAASGGAQAMVNSQDSTYRYFYSAVWTPDDRGLLALSPYDTPSSGHLLYVDLGAGTVTPVASWPGRTLVSVAVDQHWDVFMGTDQLTPSGNGNTLRIEAVWLGRPGTITTLADTGYVAGPTVATGGPADPRPAGLPAPVTPKVILFELRGTRGSVTDTSPTDGVTNTFTKAVTDQLHGQVLPVPVQYKAVPLAGSIRITKDFVNGAYVTSEQQGIANLRDAVRNYQKQYPMARLAFVGYSSGAQVVRTVIAAMSHPEQNKVAFVVTYGDPLFLSGQSFDRGHWVSGLTGIYWAARVAKPTLPDPGFTSRSIREGHAGMSPALASRTEDWCAFGDPVANWPSALILQHFAYAPKDKPGPYIVQGAAFAAGMVR